MQGSDRARLRVKALRTARGTFILLPQKARGAPFGEAAQGPDRALDSQGLRVTRGGPFALLTRP